jgi:hypothetical protein
MKESHAEKKFQEDGVVVRGGEGDGRGRSGTENSSFSGCPENFRLTDRMITGNQKKTLASQREKM